nr:hypothetical protein [uncultured Thermosynechococcus sp.]
MSLPLHLRVLDTHHRGVFAGGGRGLGQKVAAHVGYAGMNPSFNRQFAFGRLGV